MAWFKVMVCCLVEAMFLRVTMFLALRRGRAGWQKEFGCYQRILIVWKFYPWVRVEISIDFCCLNFWLRQEIY